jgi:tryptophanyl-tRNA synthetase
MNRVMKTDFFPLPTSIISKFECILVLVHTDLSKDPGKRILALKGDPPKKMSKSASDPRSRILITDTSKEIHDKLKIAFTDSIDPESLPKDHIPTIKELSPGVANLYTILSCCTGEDISTLIPRYYRRRYGYLKNDVAEAVDAKLTPIREEYERLRRPDGEAWLRAVAMMGRERASTIALENLARVKAHLGIAPL